MEQKLLNARYRSGDFDVIGGRKLELVDKIMYPWHDTCTPVYLSIADSQNL